MSDLEEIANLISYYRKKVKEFNKINKYIIIDYQYLLEDILKVVENISIKVIYEKI